MTGKPARIGAIGPAQKQATLWPRALALGLISASGIAFELTLTRVFSMLFQYHYVFLAISLAILGLGLGAVLVKLVRVEESRAAQTLQRVLIALSLSFPLAAIALANLPSTVSIVLHVMISLVPFALLGAAAALIFMLWPQSSGSLYAADLIGAAIGIVAALVLLGALGAFNVISALGLVVAMAAFANARRPLPLHVVAQNASHPFSLGTGMIAPGLCIALSVAVIAINRTTGLIDYALARVADAPPDKTMLALLRDPSQGARIVYSAWDPFARVDVVETNDDTSKYVFTDGGAGSYMLRFDGDLSQVTHLRATLEFLPFADTNAARTLILGAGAGKDVLLALLANSQHITAVEVNPSMVDVTRRFGAYNGHIFDQPQVTVHTGDARTFAEHSTEQFDLIYLNLVYSQAAPPATQALAENYVFTREAFRAYLGRLASGGRLAIIAHNGIEGTRAAITAIAALNDLGVPLPQALDHLALLMRNDDNPTLRTTAMILSKDALTQREIETLSTTSQALGLQPLHLPGEFELGFQPLKNGQPLEQFLAVDQTYELFPTDDNRPFFYKLDPGVPAPIAQATLCAAVLALLIVILLLGQTRADHSPRLIGYLAAIGLGFLLIEIPLIQRFQLLLGYPALSFALVAGTLLLSGGAGSWISQRWHTAQLPRRVRIAAVAIAALGLLYALALPPVLSYAVALPAIARALIIILLTAP
ncbi:MAG: methyltransferase domain-containing protein, partial [Chloroflexi bacterium]|nr:methyltransferase domain-containing protein [Chloroflexota bacterium]